MLHRYLLVLLLPGLGWTVFAGIPNVSAAADARRPESQDPFYEPDAPLVPKHPRTEAEQDQVTAAALFAHGRMLLQRGQQEAALRRLERAWRYDPQAVSILDDVIRLAYRLRQPEVSARYAVIQVEAKPEDPIMLRRLASLLSSQGDLRRAADLFEKSLQTGKQPEGFVGEAEVLRDLGQLYLLLGEDEKSAAALEKLLEALDHPEKSGLDKDQVRKLLGKPERTYTLMAESFLETKRLDLAEEMFRRADKAHPDAPLLAFNVARVDAKRGKTAEALQKLDEYFAAKESSGGIRPYRLLSELLEAKHDDKAVAQKKLLEKLEKLYADDAANADLAYFLAAKQAEADQLEKAAATFAEVIQLPNTADTYQGLFDVQRRRGKPDEMIAALGQVALQTARVDSLEEEVKQVVADAGLLGKVLARAEERKRDDRLKPGEALGVAHLALAARKFDLADEMLKAALEEDAPPREQVLSAWGLELLAAERYGQAVKTFEQAVKAASEKQQRAALEFYLAFALELDGKTNDALNTARKVAALLPESVRFQSRPAWILYHAKRYKEAEQAYEELIAKYDGDHSSTETRNVVREARLALSNICVHLGDMPQAEEWLEQVLDEFPEDTGALNDLGYLWSDQGKHLERSLRMVQRAIEAEPDNVAYRDSLGWAHYRLGAYGKAVEHLRQAAGGDDPGGVILDHLGDAYLKVGQTQQALESWRRAADSFEKESDTKLLERTQRKIAEHSK